MGWASDNLRGDHAVPARRTSAIEAAMSASASLSRSTTFLVDGGLDAPAAARRLLAERCAWPPRRVRDETALMLAEVVANAVVHGGMGTDRQVRIDVEELERLITLRVYDAGTDFAATRDDWRASGGLGLVIVDQLAHRWGVARNGDGNCVWFEVAVS
jgi:anti-sigma regulatory factor (Ser/Thr protein kinase)